MLVYLLLAHLLYCDLFAEGNPDGIFCDMTESGQVLAPPINGNFKPAKTGPGEYFRVLVAFAQFASDTVQNSSWLLNQLPNWRNDIIDGAVSTTYPNGYRDETLSDYFDKASLGKFDFIGDVYQDTIIIPSKIPYGSANLYVLQELKENIPDFRRYDNWNCTGSYPVFSEGSGDGYVDMLIVIYRRADSTNFGVEGGIASLNLPGTEDFVIDDDNDLKVKVGRDVSKERGGITTCAGLSDRFTMVGHLAHEYGHYMFSSFHTSMGGLMSDFYDNSTYMMSAYEREYLGYITCKLAVTDGELVTLRDFVKYGDALKIITPSGRRYLVENHQRLHKYDQLMRGQPLDGNYNLNTTVGSGIYIWHFLEADGNYPTQNFIKSADGAWNWEFDGTFYAPEFYVGEDWQDTVPKFKRTSVNRNTGTSDRTPDLGVWHRNHFPKWVDTNPFTGEYELTRDCMGEENDAFNLEYNQLFTPWSNPSSYLGSPNNISLELVSKIGTENNYILKFYNTQASALALPPSKPTFLRVDPNYPYTKLTWEGNSEPDVISGGTYAVYKSNSRSGPWVQSALMQHDAGSSVQSFIDETFPRSDTSFYKVMAIDNTSLSSIYSDIVSKPPSFASDEVWSGTINLLGTVTVPAGKTLILNPGTTLNFSNGNKLVISGTLNAAGNLNNRIIFNFTTPNSTTQNGIQINNNGSTISFCNITNAQFGIFLNSHDCTINHNIISNCYLGIYASNIDYTAGTTIIDENRVSNCTLADFYCAYSSPVLTNNNFGDNSIGVASMVTFTSSPQFGYYSDNGNYFHNSVDGIYAYYQAMFSGRNNIIENNQRWNLLAMSNCNIDLRFNWWGSTDGSYIASKIRNYDGTSTINYLDWLTTRPPFPIAKVNVISENYQNDDNFERLELSETDSLLMKKLMLALNYKDTKDLNSAKSICQEIMNNYPETDYSKSALNLLWQIYRESDLDYIKGYLKQLSDKKEKKSLHAFAEIILSGYEKDKIKALDLIIEKYKGSDIIEIALMNKFFIYLHENEDLKLANRTFMELGKQFPNSQSALIAGCLLYPEKFSLKSGVGLKFEQNNNQEEELSKVEIPDKYELKGNYPNPFNPVTVIKFGLPQNSKVVLEVYSILGEKVETLVNETKTAGYYEAKFDGSNLSSGIYVYRLTANSLESGEVFVKAGKMMLIK